MSEGIVENVYKFGGLSGDLVGFLIFYHLQFETIGYEILDAINQIHSSFYKQTAKTINILFI
jgi:hypothetical protein